MTNQEILEKAIRKAIDGGWKATLTIANNGHVNLDADNLHLAFYQDYEGEHSNIIFNHGFAKALWGAEPKDIYLRFKHSDGLHDTFQLPMYLFHLQQMVIDVDPIKYLGDNI